LDIGSGQSKTIARSAGPGCVRRRPVLPADHFIKDGTEREDIGARSRHPVLPTAPATCRASCENRAGTV
jgi:hypothetical protein